jgi:hypothetical protein
MDSAKTKRQLDDISKLFYKIQGSSRGGSDVEHIHFLSLCTSAVESMAGKQHSLYREIERIREAYADNLPGATCPLFGVISALQSHVEGDYLRSGWSIAHVEIFDDHLQMANHLLDSGYKDAAAVMCGAVLESHLRQLCIANGIAIEATRDGKVTRLTGSPLNDALKTGNAYKGNEHKQVTAWLAIRNDAAHGQYNMYTDKQVTQLIDGIRRFVADYPA